MKVRDSYINDDLADEVEAIRLAADFTSRRLMSQQRRDSVAVSAASASRLRIRSLLDKQKTVRVSIVIILTWKSKMMPLQDDEDDDHVEEYLPTPQHLGIDN